MFSHRHGLVYLSYTTNNNNNNNNNNFLLRKQEAQQELINQATCIYIYIYIWMHNSFEFLYLCLAKKNIIPTFIPKNVFFAPKNNEWCSGREHYPNKGTRNSKGQREPREKTIEDKGCDMYVHYPYSLGSILTLTKQIISFF